MQGADAGTGNGLRAVGPVLNPPSRESTSGKAEPSGRTSDRSAPARECFRWPDSMEISSPAWTGEEAVMSFDFTMGDGKIWALQTAITWKISSASVQPSTPQPISSSFNGTVATAGNRSPNAPSTSAKSTPSPCSTAGCTWAPGPRDSSFAWNRTVAGSIPEGLDYRPTRPLPIATR